MKIGNLILEETPLFLAPMEDVTYESFRWICKKYGADVVYTEFISSEGLVRNNNKTKQKMVLSEFDRPAAIQIYGHNINSVVYAAQVAEESQPDFIDLNFGCPMKKIIRNGSGAAILKDLKKMQQMATEVVKAVKVPVTAKTRLGWNEKEKPILEAASRLQDAGIAALAIHGRTREQLYSGRADWTLIGEVKNHPRIKMPIIGNGDITSGEKAKTLLEQTGVDALMIGRPAIGRPWIFKEIKYYLQTGNILPPPTVAEIAENAKTQLHLTLKWKKNEKITILLMRRHFAKYFPGLSGFRKTKTKLLRAESISEIHEILDEIVEEYGNLSPDYSATEK